MPLTGTKLSGQYTVAILNRAPHEAAAKAFVKFLLGKPGRKILQANGVMPIVPAGAYNATTVTTTTTTTTTAP